MTRTEKREYMRQWRKKHPGYGAAQKRAWYLRNKERVHEYNAERRKNSPKLHRQYDQRSMRRRKEVAREWLHKEKNAPCLDCRKKYPVICMDFDHVRGRKLFTLSHAWRFSPSERLKERKKCELVCSNCHRIREERRRARIYLPV